MTNQDGWPQTVPEDPDARPQFRDIHYTRNTQDRGIIPAVRDSSPARTARTIRREPHLRKRRRHTRSSTR